MLYEYWATKNNLTHWGTFFQSKKYAQNNEQKYIVPDVKTLFDRVS